jgi:hypothetical protein
MTLKALIPILAAAAVCFALDLRVYEPKQITTDPSKESDVVIKDETAIYFASDRSGNFDVYKKDLIKETVTRLTFQPSNEYPKYFEKKILMESDETDAHGNLYFLTESGDQELLLGLVGKEKDPFIKDGKVYFSEDYRSKTSLKYFEPGSKKKPVTVRVDTGGKALFTGRNEILFQSNPNEGGYNDLFTARIKNDIAGEPVQITFGQKIITGFDVSKDGNTVVYSAVTTDTNGDSKLDLYDNPILFRINRTEGYFSDPVQLTPESYASSDPGISPSGQIFFISDRKGSADVWSCGMNGVAPLMPTGLEQAEISGQILEKYKAEVLLSEAFDEKVSEKTIELLSMALISYNRCLTFSDIPDEAKAIVYFRIAEIYEIQGNLSRAESIYRIIQSRYGAVEELSAQAEIGRSKAELKRKGIGTKELGYELDDHIRYLIGLSDKYSSITAKNLILLRTGEIYQDLGRHTEANGYFLRADKRTGGTLNPESYFRQAKSSFADGNYNAGADLFNTAINSAFTDELKEKYIREYFVFEGLERTSVSERVSGTISNEALPKELRSYANYIMAGITDDRENAVSYYGECRKYYVTDPGNGLLKKFSAEADLALGRSYIGSKQTEAAEGVLKYMIANYKDISYGVFSSVAMKMLSDIYLENAAVYNGRKMYDNALLSFTKAFELDGSGIEAIRGISDSYFMLNRIDEAARYFTPFYESNRNSAYLNYALGYTYSIRGASPGRKSLDDILLAISLINRTLELDSGIKHAYLTLSYCHEAAYQIKLTQAETEKDKNIVLKGLDFVTGPLKFVLETVNLIDDSDIDHTDAAISVLNRGLSLTDPGTDRELYLKLRLNLANNYYNMGEYARKQALDHYLAVIIADYPFSSKKQEAVIAERTGHCLFTTGDDRAEEYYDKAAKLYRELNDRHGELRVSMRTALMYLTKEDDEGDLIAGDDAFQKYSDILIKLKSEDNKEAISLILRNSAFAKFIDSEYNRSSGILQNILDSGVEYKDGNETDNFIILSLLGLDIPVWKLNLVLGSQFAEGFEGRDELALLYAIKASSYSKLKDFGPVKKMLAEKAEIFRQKDNRLALSLIENRLGIVDYFTGNYEHSIKKFENSEKMCIELGLYNSALENRNNILKAALKVYGKDKTDQIRKLTADTVVTSLSFPTAGIFEKAVNRNLNGVLYYKLFSTGKEGSPAEKYASIRDLLKAEKFFFEADTLLSSSPGSNEEKNRLSAAILYNLSSVQFQSGMIEEAKITLGLARERSELTYDKLLHWRIELLSGDLENSPKLKLDHYTRSEELLSEYLPPTGDYELISGWKDDIRPLYDRLIIAHLEKNDLFTALNYAERFKNRTLLNYYSSRNLEFKEQLHNIHVKKIRYNNDEIARYRQRAELMRSKNAEKFAKQILEYEERADFYEKELNDIYDQIEKSGDERLLQFVSIEDMNSEDISDLLGEDMALISIYSLPDEELFFYYDGVEVKTSRAKAAEYEKIFDGFESDLVGKEHVFIVPDFNESVNADFVKIFHRKGFFNKKITGSSSDDIQLYSEVPKNNIISVLPSVSSLKMVSGNENINYSELKVCSDADVKEEDIAAYFENGGIIYFDKPVKVNPSNSLEDVFYLGQNELKMSDLLKMKMPAYAVVINGFDGTIRPEDKMILANTLIFSGVQSVIIQENMEGQPDLSEKIFNKAAEYDLTTILTNSKASYTLIGMKGMDKQEQTDFATSNLKNSLLDGARYFGRKVYEKAAVYFIQALAMARNTGDVQEYNILKTIVTCMVNIKDYKRAIVYTQQLIEYTEKNGNDNWRLSAYDDLSRNYILNKQYDEAALWQNRILDDKKSSPNVKVTAYNMLSIIYSYKGDLKESIRYKKQYLKSTRLLTSDDITSINRELNEKSTETLFNSLRNILVSYYKQGETDSALFVYDTIMENLEVFEDVDGSSFGELTNRRDCVILKNRSIQRLRSFIKRLWSILRTMQSGLRSTLILPTCIIIQINFQMR